MTIIEILYVIAAAIALCAFVPQLHQLIRVKASDELNLSTWVMWSSTQAVSLAYTISISNVLLIVVNALWVGFYLAMVVMILYYRRNTSVNQTILAVEKVSE